jgi:hypothetical protein
MFTNTKLHMAVVECKLAMCVSRLAEFELLLELKFEQKKGTSLDSPSCRLQNSPKQRELPMYKFDSKI